MFTPAGWVELIQGAQRDTSVMVRYLGPEAPIRPGGHFSTDHSTEHDIRRDLWRRMAIALAEAEMLRQWRRVHG